VSLNVDLLQRMLTCGHLLHHRFTSNLSHRRILRELSLAGGTLEQKSLQKKMRVRAGSLSAVLGKLEEAGKIKRHLSETDHRKLLVHLTPLGASEADAEVNEREETADMLFSVLSDDQKTMLIGTLDRLIVHWDSEYVRKAPNRAKYED